ncbi:MAG TPA: DUF885 family protein, partial [Humibacter sp.]|nr:DUF885 family protein [Humibacter sp.]
MSSEQQRTPTPIDQIAEDWIDTQLELFPEFHVYLGRPGREGEYADYSPEGHEKASEATAAALSRIEVAEPVDEVDTITKLDLTRELRLELEKHDAGFEQRDLNVIASPEQQLREVFDISPTATVGDWEAIATRLHNLPGAMRGYIATLRAGIQSGRVPAIRQVREGIIQADKQLAPNGFFYEFAGEARPAEGELPESLKKDLEKGAAQAAAAYGELSVFLDDELAVHAPEQDAVGREIYSLASRSFLGATVDLDETYEWGVEELRRMVAEQEAIAREIKPGASVAEAIEFLDGD